MRETTSRMLELLALLQARPTWNSTELADRFAVSARTVRNDIERLVIQRGDVLGSRADTVPNRIEVADAERSRPQLAQAARRSGGMKRRQPSRQSEDKDREPCKDKAGAARSRDGTTGKHERAEYACVSRNAQLFTSLLV